MSVKQPAIVVRNVTPDSLGQGQTASNSCLPHIVPRTPVTISVFDIKEWDKYKLDFFDLERLSFTGGLRFEPAEVTEIICRRTAIIVVAKDGNRIIGAACGGPLEEEREEVKGDREAAPFAEMFEIYGKDSRRVFYVDDFAVLPGYRGKGVGTELKRALFKEAKKAGYDLVLGHAAEGQTLKINLGFGAHHIRTYETWFGVNEPHHLYELDLHNMHERLSVPGVRQSELFTCGPASLRAVLLYYEIDASEGDIARLAGTTRAIGTPHDGMVSAAQTLRMNTATKYGSHIRDLEDGISNGMPVIVNYVFEGVGHYSVVVGYDKQNLFIMNTYTATTYVVSKRRFERNWHSKRYGDRWMLVMTPKTAPTP